MITRVPPSLLVLAGVAVVATTALLAADARAQTVTFDPPTEVVIAPGRLSVTFRADVTQASAEALVKQLGLEVVQSRFSDIEIIANADAPFPDDAVAALEAHPRVKEVERFAIPIVREFHVRVVFDSTIDSEEAEWIVSEWRGSDTSIVEVVALPREIIVGVRPGREEDAIGVLKASELVADVVYVAELQD